MELTDSFDDLADTEMWIEVAALGAGFMGASIIQTVGEGAVPFDLPNEVYGLGVAYVGFTVDMDHSNKVAMGGGLYTVDSLAQRAGLKNQITSIAGGS